MSVVAPIRAALPATGGGGEARIPRSLIRRALTFCRRQPLGTFGLALVLLVAAAGLSADWIAPYNPTANDFAAMTEAPSWAHLLGTDQFGRDLFSRIVFGARTALIVGFSCAIVGGAAGLVLGVASAYFGGRIDLLIQRVVDVGMAFPLIILARACGFGATRIILCHMVPNVMAPFLILLTAFVGQAILAEASLSYLGLGVQEPTPAWGLMLQGGAEEYAAMAPWIAVFPGLAIALTVFGISLFGDALRDALDPKLRER